MNNKLPVLSRWPLLRQLLHGDFAGLGQNAASERTRELAPRTATADRVARSICPYCAVGCGQLAYVKDERIVDIEGIRRAGDRRRRSHRRATHLVLRRIRHQHVDPVQAFEQLAKTAIGSCHA